MAGEQAWQGGRLRPSWHTGRLLVLLLGGIAATHGYGPPNVARLHSGQPAISKRAPVPVCLLRGLSRFPKIWNLKDGTAFERELTDAKKDGVLMIVKFSQPRCTACHELGLKLGQLTRRRQSLRIFDVDYKSMDGRQIAKMGGVEITGLPTVAIFDRGEMIYSKPVPLRLYPNLEEMINFYEEVVVKHKNYGERNMEEFENRQFRERGYSDAEGGEDADRVAAGEKPAS